MEKFIGTKIIKAFPEKLTWKEHYDKRGWDWPDDKEGAERIGYTVGYADAAGNFNGKLEGGCEYITWSPADVFEAAYKKISGMTFGLAVEAMKEGCKVARIGWNGNGMFAIYQKGYPEGIEVNAQTAEAYSVAEGTVMKFRPYMQLKTAQNDCAMWAPSGSEALAEDWLIVE